MANTRSLSQEDRKKAKRAARQKNQELFSKLKKVDRKKFLEQLHDKKAKSKVGIVTYSKALESKEAAAE